MSVVYPLAPASGPPGPGSPSLHSVQVWTRDTHMPLMLTGRRRERASWGRERHYHAGLGPSQETPFWLDCAGGREGKSDSPRTPEFPDLSHLATASLKTRGGGCQQKVNRNLFLESETPGWRTQGQKSENGELRAMHAPLPHCFSSGVCTGQPGKAVPKGLGLPRCPWSHP